MVDTWAGRRLKLTERGLKIAKLLTEVEEEPRKGYVLGLLTRKTSPR